MSLGALRAALLDLAARGGTITYGALARDLSVPGPGSIARLTEAMEALMAEDAAAGRPFLASVCEGRLSGGLPARGFFETARRLGRYSGPDDGAEARAFAEAERLALRELAQNSPKSTQS